MKVNHITAFCLKAVYGGKVVIWWVTKVVYESMYSYLLDCNTQEFRYSRNTGQVQR